MDEALRLEVCCGGVLLSHNLSVAVPLALPGLASRFGMEAGRFPGAMTTTRMGVQHCPPLLVVGVWVDRGLYSGCGCFACLFCCSPVGWVLFSVGPLVPVGSRAPRGASTSGLSTRSSGGGLSPHWGAWKSHLEAGFPLRCFQRLSLPNVANQPCTWRYNWHTRGSSIPVLSY